LPEESFSIVFDQFDGIALHPIQFLELAAKAAYKHSRLGFSPRYISSCLDEPGSEVMVRRTTFPAEQPWDQWVDNDYAHLFCALASHFGFKGVPEPHNFYVEGKHHTWLFDSNGVPQQMPD
jgi:hypothetical protein